MRIFHPGFEESGMGAKSARHVYVQSTLGTPKAEILPTVDRDENIPLHLRVDTGDCHVKDRHTQRLSWIL